MINEGFNLHYLDVTTFACNTRPSNRYDAIVSLAVRWVPADEPWSSDLIYRPGSHFWSPQKLGLADLKKIIIIDKINSYINNLNNKYNRLTIVSAFYKIMIGKIKLSNKSEEIFLFKKLKTESYNFYLQTTAFQ